MIPDPQNVFEELQNDVAAQIMATSPFTTIANPDGSTPFNVLTEDEGDIQFEYDQMIQQLGLSIVVHSPEGPIEQPDLPGPIITKLGFDVWVSEAPTFNRSELGTRLRLWKATIIVMGTLHGFQPQSIKSPIYASSVRKERERAYIEGDQPGTLIVSRICHFIAPQVAAEVSS
jgi:hypothetical protein